MLFFLAHLAQVSYCHSVSSVCMARKHVKTAQGVDHWGETVKRKPTFSTFIPHSRGLSSGPLRWRRGNGLHCGSDDLGLIPDIPSHAWAL